MRTHRLLLFLPLLLIGVAVPLTALDYVEVEGALAVVGSTRSEAAPSPLLPAVGISFPIVQRSFWEIQSGLLLFGSTYKTANGVSYPTEIENRDYWVVALAPDLRAGLRLPLSQALSIGASLGVALMLRGPIPLFPDATANLEATLSYLYGSGRFFYPESQVDVRLGVAEGIDLRLGARALWPVFHLWDGEGLAFSEQLVVCALVGVLFRL